MTVWGTLPGTSSCSGWPSACYRAFGAAIRPSRYGGDEFVLLLPEVDDERHALVVAQKIHARLAEPLGVDDCSIAVTASIGVAVYPIDGVSQVELIKRADFAMYRAKTGRNASKDSVKRAMSR